jgi:hypothetical protein
VRLRRDSEMTNREHSPLAARLAGQAQDRQRSQIDSALAGFQIGRYDLQALTDIRPEGLHIEAVVLGRVWPEQLVGGLQQEARAGQQAEPELVQGHAHPDQPLIEISAPGEPEMLKGQHAIDITAGIKPIDKEVPLSGGFHDNQSLSRWCAVRRHDSFTAS